MSIRRAVPGVLVLALACGALLAGGRGKPVPEECTIGAAVGSATTDGRPMIWKTRDWSEPDNEIRWHTSQRYRFISVGDARSNNTLMGLNECGFAILNSASSDLPGGRGLLGNGTMQHLALGTCGTVAEFEELLKRTNSEGRNTRANFAVMDSTGRAAIFETGGTEYWKYEAGDAAVAPGGYVLRTNFAEHGGGSGGIERYRRTTTLVPELHVAGELNYRSILRVQMRDFSDEESRPVPVPYEGKWSPDAPEGLINTRASICRNSSVSAAVFQGVREDEPAILSTMWTMLGQPATSITVPYWAVGEVPPEVDGPRTAPLCDEANRIRGFIFGRGDEWGSWLDSRKLRDGRGGGLWSVTFAAEDSIFTAAEALLDSWRRRLPGREVILNTEYALAGYAHSILKGYHPETPLECDGCRVTWR